MHFIAGSGKTILSSTVIDSLQQIHNDDQGKSIAYFYFDFTDSRKSAVEGCIRNLLRQISAPTPCEAVRTLYRRQCGGRIQPTLGSVLLAFKDALEPLGRVFLVIDALDECEDIVALAEVMKFINSLTRISVLVTSHMTPVVQQLMLAVQESTIEIEVARVTQDMRTFVNHRLYAGEESSRRWSDEGMRHIQERVISRSAGM
jgi:hypothetical protein